MKKPLFTPDQMKDLAGEYFESNPQAEYLVGSTHDGVFYLPENAGYCQSNAVANDAEVVKVTREGVAPLTTTALNGNVNRLAETSQAPEDLVAFLKAHLTRVANGEAVDVVLADMLTGALPLPVLMMDQDAVDYVLGLDAQFTDGLDYQPAPLTALADLVASATHFTFPVAAAEAPAAGEEKPAAKAPKVAKEKAAKAPKVAKAPNVAAAPKKAATAAKATKSKPSTKTAE
ncbi:MAG: hypothetical protein V4621_08165 [Pseudomonadota bacterium]